MKDDNGLMRVMYLLLLTLAVCIGLYFIPAKFLGIKLKRVDLISDLRNKVSALDSINSNLIAGDTLKVDSVALRDSLIRSQGIDSASLALRDSLYKELMANQSADSNFVRIEDFSAGHTGLRRFFEALKNRETLNRPVYVAYLGDSFIEGDILVSDFRHYMQDKFGGCGVGFVPITSISSQFRPTVSQTGSGWKAWSMLRDRGHAYTLSGMLFDATSPVATVTTRGGNRYPELRRAPLMKFSYERNTATELRMTLNGSKDTLTEVLPPTTEVTQIEKRGNYSSAFFKLINTTGFRALGVAMDADKGVVVDNYSLRGNSGIILQRLNTKDCQALNRIRPYDLIILQYGLNVTSDSLMHYGWYAEKMMKAINQVRVCFPKADVLLLGVSDRSRMNEGTFETMPAVVALLRAQRNLAQTMGLPFWNVFGAMGGTNSMVRYVNLNWASKDYTHLGFRGGKEIATSLFRALMEEKNFYDEADKMGN